MCKTRISAIAIVLAATGGCAIATGARADIKIVESITIDSSQLKKIIANMPPSQRAALAKQGGGIFEGSPEISTLISSGTKYRTNNGPFIEIIDLNAKKTTFLNPDTHTYQSIPLHTNAVTMKGMTASAHDTGQTKVILGHKARHYTIVMSMATMAGASIKGDIWATQDLPQPPNLEDDTSSPMALLQDEMKTIKGMPLIMTMIITGGPLGDMTIKEVVESISMQKNPASLFAIPAGYTAEPGTAPGMGGMGR